MWKSLSIAQKIWFSFSILLIGYCVSIVLGFRLGQQTERRLYTASETLFTAATQSQTALTAFNEQIKLYNNAIILEDESFLESAQERAKEAEHALQTIVGLNELDSQKRNEVREILKQLKGFTTSAQIVYSAMTSASEFIEGTEDTLEEQAVRLAQQTALLQETLGSLAQTYSDNLKDELSNISQVTRSRRYVEVITFFVVVISALIVTALFLKRSILTPLKHLTGIASKIAVGDLSGGVDLHSKDELGMVADAFREMIAYIRDIAQIAQRVAVGEIDVHVKPKSPHDVLNLAFAETIQYIQNVANIAEKISRKELQVVVTPKSDQDVLNLSFQRMVTNLQEMMEEIHTSMMSVQQLNWIRTGQAELNTRIRGEQDIETLAQNTITYLATYLNAQIGAIYLISDHARRLTLVGSYAYVDQKEHSKDIPIGVGLVGQVALGKQRIVFEEVPDNYIRISSGLGQVPPKYILVTPFLYEEQVKGVIELGAVHQFTEPEMKFLDRVLDSIAIAFHSSQYRVRMQELLKETQRQAGELRVQQEQLEKTNTELKEAEEELRKANQQLQEASQHKSDFLANMSHELRTPLNAIIGFTSMTISALKDKLPSEHLENLIKSEHSARTLMQLINDVLDFSKIEAGAMQTLIEEVQLEEIIEEIVVTTEGLILDKGISLNEEIAPDLPAIESDFVKVKQILNNLMSNAVKFTTEGSVTIRASVINQPTPNWSIRVEVEDTGCGIPVENVAAIFESFKQVDGSIKKKFGGTGLGLAITKRLCHLLGIEIGVRSEENKGTMFWLNIPIKCQAGDAQIEQETSPQLPASSTQEPEEFLSDLDTKALVLCLSTPKTCEALKRHLGGLPLDVQQVNTVAECAKFARAQVVWTILVEPNGEGFEALSQLKSEEPLQYIPILLYSLEAKQRGFQQLGPIDHLAKPIEKDQLLEVLLRVTKKQAGDILIVDDDAEIRLLYGKILSSAGYTPHVVKNGRKALDFLHDHPLPQAILLDLLMPEMDGFQVLEQLQITEAWQRIPVIVVTGITLTPEDRKRIHEGAQLLLQKENFSIEELPRQIASVVHTVMLAGMRTILLIDDNQMNLDLMSSVFQTVGYTVYMADSGPVGIELAKSIVPDVILMDLAMPHMDGIEATQHLKQHPVTSDITVIACTAFATEDYQKRAFQAGCEGYITKPVEPERLVDQVTKLVLTSKIRKRIGKLDDKNTAVAITTSA